MLVSPPVAPTPLPDAPARPPDSPLLTRVGRVWVIRIVDRRAAAARFRPLDEEEGA